VLSAIWDEFGKPCGKLLVPMIGGMIDFPAESEEPRYGITEEIRGLLQEVSASEADLLLKPARKAFEIRGASTTRSVQTPQRSRIPIKTPVAGTRLSPDSSRLTRWCTAALRRVGSFAKH
jgi:hypothetical protein